MEHIKQKKYAFFDADNVGPTIEILMRENRVEEAANLSNLIKSAFLDIEKELQSRTDIKIIMFAGDDLLIEFSQYLDSDYAFLDDIRKFFYEKTDLSLSCGIGLTVPNAVENLYLAKLYGKDKIVGAKL